MAPDRAMIYGQWRKQKNPQDDLADRDLYSGLIRLHILHHAAEEPIFGLGMIEELARHGYRISAGSPASAWIGEKGLPAIGRRAERQIVPEDLSGHPTWQDSAEGGQEQDTRVVSRNCRGQIKVSAVLRP
jgi:hypothetical protein